MTRSAFKLKFIVLLVLVPASVVLAALWWPFGANTPDLQLKEELSKASTEGSLKSQALQALIQAGVDPNDLNEVDKDGSTALMLAARAGHTETVQVLIQAGADLNKANEYGITALMRAAHEGHAETVQALIQAGVDLNKATKDGIFTALIWAALQGHTEIVQLLRAAGARK